MDYKARNKIILFAEDMTVYVENLKESTKTNKLLEFFSKFSQVTGHFSCFSEKSIVIARNIWTLKFHTKSFTIAQKINT